MTNDISQLFQRALKSHQSGGLEEAKRLYGDVLAIEPRHADSLHLLGVLEGQEGNPIRAIELINQAIAVKPNVALYHNNLGNAYKEKREFQPALNSYARAIELNPAYAEAFCNSGVVLSLVGRYGEARVRQEYAIFLQPRIPEFRNSLGVTYASEGNNEAAIKEYEKAIELRRDFAEAYCNRGNALHRIGRHQAAIADYRRALEIKSDYVEALSNLGNVYAFICDHTNARELHERAIQIKYSYAEAHNNLGFTLSEMGLYEEALASYRRALELEPGYPMAHWNLACCLLQLGEYEPGWQEYEWRWKYDLPAGSVHSFGFGSPQWTGGESLAGKSILLHAEQGFGDTIQFCRYARRVKSLGANVILRVQNPLKKLISTFDGEIKVLGEQEPLPSFDYHCPLLSLPLAFKTSSDSVPGMGRYLSVDQECLRHWTERLGPKKRFRVGVVWSGNARHTKDHRRSMTFDQIIKCIPENVECICLHKELRDGERGALDRSGRVQFFGEEIKDFSDTAALCELMDLVISVDTSVAHLAGALDGPVWVLLPTNPDWRWLVSGQECAWYPSARLFRQEKPCDWSNVIDQVKSELGEIVERNE